MEVIDLRILEAVQQEIPLCSEPFSVIASQLDIDVDELLARLHRLVETGHIKRIGGIFDSRRLGYCGTLCGMQVPEDRIEEVAAILNGYPGITHNYLRDDDNFNMWFTVQALGNEELERMLKQIIKETGITSLIDLPSVESYKIKVKFDV